MKQLFSLAAGLALLTGCSTQKPSGSAPASAPAAPTDVVNQSLPHVPGADLGKRDAEGYTIIFDGTWEGWRVSENPGTWNIINGAFRANGDRSHNYYVGPLQPFKDFELKLQVMTEPGSNGGVYIHTKFQDSGWPWGGYEIQVNNSHTDWRRTASVYSVKDVKEVVAKDNQWWDYVIRVKGDTIQIYVDGKLVNEFKEEAGRQPGKDFERKLNAGTFALQGHDPKSVVYYKNIRVKRLD